MKQLLSLARLLRSRPKCVTSTESPLPLTVFIQAYNLLNQLLTLLGGGGDTFN